MSLQDNVSFLIVLPIETLEPDEVIYYCQLVSQRVQVVLQRVSVKYPLDVFFICPMMQELDETYQLFSFSIA